MRFDDSLSTVLAADTGSAFGAQSAFRQIVDLIGRGRAPADSRLLDRLRALRPQVPVTVRAASARALALAGPPAALVELFAGDEPSVASPVLRSAVLDEADWLRLLAGSGPTGRAVLRARRDLPETVVRGLASFGPTDFSLEHADARAESAKEEAVEPPPSQPGPPPPHGFGIADLVDRIATFQRERAVPATEPVEPRPDRFSFETDAGARIRWTDAVPRGAVLGLTLSGPAAEAVRGRRPIDDAPLTLDGGSALAGDWQVAGRPMFDPADGRFLGLRATAWRVQGEPASGEAIRRLVHELRTPVNAISGFAELIGSQLLGPVEAGPRRSAMAIHEEAARLLRAIEDLDTAARIEGNALEIEPLETALWPLLAGAAERHAGRLHLSGDPAVTATVDRRSAARLADRLAEVLLAATDPAERVVIEVGADSRWATISSDRPTAWAQEHGARALTIDAHSDMGEGSPLLGTGFTLRLIGDLARALGGRLDVDERLVLRLPRRSAMEARTGER